MFANYFTSSAPSDSAITLVPSQSRPKQRSVDTGAWEFNEPVSPTYSLTHLSRHRNVIRMPRSVLSYRNVHQTVVKRLPCIFREREFDTKYFDKIYACKWINDEDVAMGTKSNELLVLNTRSGKIRKTSGIPSSNAQSMQPTGPAKGGIHDIAINNNTGLLATGAMNPDHIALYDTADMSARAILEGHTDWVFALQWLDQNTLISGSRDHTVALWSVDSDASVRPHPLMEDVNVYAPKFRFKEDRDHSNKVRDMRLAPGKQLLTLYCDGVLNTWDMERFQITSSLQLAYQQETCCMALKEDDPHYIAIGSNKYVSFMDIRAPDSTLAIPSVDEMWGVRSLSFNGNIATVGGGKGRVSFFDLRARKYLSLCQEESHECLDHHHHENEAPNVHRVHEHEHTNTNIRDSVRYSDMRGQDRIVSVGVPHRRRRVPVKNLRNRGSILVQDDIKAGYLEVSKGWIDANTQDDHMFPGGWPIAVYAHAYDPTGTRLFTAGGPLQVTRSGSFASLWY